MISLIEMVFFTFVQSSPIAYNLTNLIPSQRDALCFVIFKQGLICI